MCSTAIGLKRREEKRINWLPEKVEKRTQPQTYGDIIPNSDGEKKKKKKKKKNGTIPGELKKINFIIVDHGSC